MSTQLSEQAKSALKYLETFRMVELTNRLRVTAYCQPDSMHDTTSVRSGHMTLTLTRAEARELIKTWTEILDATEAEVNHVS